MAQGSEQFTWKLYPGVPRVCAECGRELRVVDVARVHTAITYSSGRVVTRFYCQADMHLGYAA